MDPRRARAREEHEERDDGSEMVDALVGVKGGGGANAVNAPPGARRQSGDSGSARGPLERGVLVSGTSSGAGDVDVSVDVMAKDLYRGHVGNLPSSANGIVV
jgi:hypothetical protein